MDYIVYECQNQGCGDKCLIRARADFTIKAFKRYEPSRYDCIVFEDMFIPEWKELYREDV